MKRYFQSTSNPKGKRKDDSNVEPAESSGTSKRKKTSDKKYKKERNDWDPKWTQINPWLVRREDEEGIIQCYKLIIL
jgi:hypothetical protein